MRLQAARAVVTGGASGLGLAVAHRLVEAGARVAVMDLRLPAEPPPGLLCIEVDVSSEPAVDSAMARAAEALGGLTFAVHCAGTSHRERVVGREGLMAQADFARVVNVNLIGTFTVCRAAANLMQHNEPNTGGERGVIVTTASIAASDGQIGQSAYAASKGGVASLTLPLAREFASFGVRVVAIAPGVFETPMVASLAEPVRAGLLAQTPFPKRFGAPEEFAALACHVYENPMLNGAVIRLDAGLRMPPR
jgi:NAD(P)-dependent dehydrogenase (short-subunit alcohol dehydrogenase family)